MRQYKNKKTQTITKPEFDIPTMYLVAAAGLALALLGAVSSQWPYVPNEQGLSSFAFCLAVAFVTVLGNLFTFGASMLLPKEGGPSISQKVANFLAAGTFLLGMFVACIYFSEGLNAWFTIVPTMPAGVILTFRLILLIPLLFLIYRAIRKVTKD